MIRPLFQRGLLFALALIPVLAFGCGGGSSPRTVNGKVNLLPKTKLEESDTIVLVFHPEGKDTGAVIADMSTKEPTFTAKMPPGKYKIAVSVNAYPGLKGSEKRQESFDQQVNKAFDQNSTRLEYEVTDDAVQSITIDLAQGSVKRD